MPTYDLAIINADIVLADGRPIRANLGVRDGRTAAITGDAIDAETTIDASGLTVLPGAIDEHLHVFRGYGGETYENATRAAAKGGVTTIVDMPLDKPPTLTVELLKDKLSVTEGACHVDYLCFGGYLESDPSEMERMAAAGAAAFKLFTGSVAPPGMYPGVDDGQALDALRRAQALGLPTTVHCENPDMVAFETARIQSTGRTDMAAWDDARPWFSEMAAAQTIALAAQATGARVIIAHVSSPQTIDAIAAARARGADVWAETCHHYLCTSKELAGDDIRFKWNPPTRERAFVDQMWEQVADGRVHTIASDHGPLPKGGAETIWEMAPGAGNGVEVMIPLVATEAIHRRGISLGRIAELTAENPAKLFGLYPRKGVIAIGSDADYAVLETNGRRTIDPNELEYHNQPPWSPFAGVELRVYPVYTVLRGKVIYAEGTFQGSPGDGQHLFADRIA